MALKDFFTNIPKTQKILLVALLFLAILAGFYYFVYRGMTAERSQLLQQRDALRRELNEKMMLAANLERLKVEIAKLEADLAQALQILPEEKEIPKLLVSINTLGLKAGVGFRVFRPGSLTQRDFYGEFPVQMKVQGTYHGLGRFFDSISKMSRIVNVSDVKIVPLGSAKEGFKETRDSIVSEFTATTFVFTGGKAGSKGGKEGGQGKKP